MPNQTVAKLLGLLLSTSVGTVACSDDDEGGSETAGPASDPRFLVQFDAGRGELPEGLVAGDGAVFVGLLGSGRLLRVAADGAAIDHGQVSPWPADTSFLVGLALDDDGSVLAAVGSLTPDLATGIYRFPAEGGAATLVVSDPGLFFPNDIEVDGGGDVYITDSMGSIFRLSGEALERWSADPLLAAANPPPCGPSNAPFPIGANGIVRDGDAVIVSNTDGASVVRIPIEEDGSAGLAEVVVGPDCENLAGIDGIVLESAGSWIAAVQGTSSLVRVRRDGSVETVLSGDPLDGPASIDLDPTDRSRIVVTNSAFASVATPGATPRPGVIEADL